MAYELTGKIKLIKDTEQFSSGFTKREMVVTVEDGNYPQDINLEFLKDKISLLDSVSVGQEVTVSFDIRGREYNGRYFNNLVGWKVTAGAGAEQAASSYPTENPAPAGGFDAFDEDIPF
ncbi:DUF3127 domain-containing protein [Halioxenophilus aromaticivorans]|uniref:DUF3127 domain-containing protein n=1 Tax=Halioxenophilus aromaticivorans TaxID=1306992 RepID=A0AAV3TZC0_9ALTE